MWKVIPCSFSELNLNVVLSCGQSFRWQQMEEGHWMSVLSDHIWSLKQDDKTGNILYMVHEPSNYKEKKPKRRKNTENGEDYSSISTSLSETDCQSILHDYFQLSVNLDKLYTEWSLADEKFQTVSAKFPGIRILRQDPIENLFSFICSSNNNISRISSMVLKLCENWGQSVGEVDGETFYSFPSLEALSSHGVETKLRNLGFGYRAKYIHQTAMFLYNERKPEWLTSLREMKYEDVHNELIQLPGVGAKVADCVCLMSLDKGNAIPVDTHVWQIASRDYLPHLKGKKSLTAKSYKEIGDFFRERFGDFAGWAHSSSNKRYMCEEIIKGDLGGCFARKLYSDTNNTYFDGQNWVLFCSDLKKFASK